MLKDKQERSKVFWFHFNKPASLAAKRPKISVHYQDKCIIVDNVECKVPIRGYIRKTQPRFVMKGAVKPSQFAINENIAIIG